jgi:hypothetical protein
MESTIYMNPRFSIQWALQWALCIWWSFLHCLWGRVLHCLATELEIRLRVCWYLECHYVWNFLVVSRRLANLQAFDCKVWLSELFYRLPFRLSQRIVRLIRVFFVPRATTPWYSLHHSCIMSNSLIIPCTYGQCTWCHENAYLYIHCSKGDTSSYSSNPPSRNRRWIC